MPSPQLSSSDFSCLSRVWLEPPECLQGTATRARAKNQRKSQLVLSNRSSKLCPDGSRFMIPEGSGRNSPTIEYLEAEQSHREIVRNRSPEELENPGLAPQYSSDKRGYDSENRGLPMGELEKELRLMDVPSSILDDLLETQKSSGAILGTKRSLLGGAGLLEGPSKSVGPQSSLLSPEFGLGKRPISDGNRGLEMRDFSSMPPSQTLSTHPLFKPTERIGAKLEFHPYFGHNVASERLDESVSIRVGHQMFRTLPNGMRNVRRKGPGIRPTSNGSQWYLLLIWPNIGLILFFVLA
jgi:hypothetical protein